MTFTEAAVEVLRLVGKPLHYKKITEVAIERNMLSHVGKTPEVTMSSRLATMVKRDRGEAPIIKVKPGVFGLREFNEEQLADLSGDVDELPEVEVENDQETAPAMTEAAAEASSIAPAGELRKPLPGADVFPEEEDDDEPILGADEEEDDDEEGEEPRAEASAGSEARAGRRRRKRRRRGAADDAAEPEPQPQRNGREVRDARDARSGRELRRDDRRERDERRRDRNERDRDRDRDRDRERDEPAIDYQREPGDGDLLGKDLADAVASVLGQGGPRGLSALRVADLLVRRGRLAGDPNALVPTLMASVRADIARKRVERARPRFRIEGGIIVLTDFLLPQEVVRAEQEVVRAAERQRERTRRAFLRKLGELPSASLAEMLATWLNAEGVVGLRAVRRPGAGVGELHLAGTLRRGAEELRLAIVVYRELRELGREKIIEARGALHHYGNASCAWLVTLGSVMAGAREEASAPLAGPVAVFDGLALATCMERHGVGIAAQYVPIAALDFELFEALRGSSSSRDRDRDRERDQDYDLDRRDRRDRGERGERERERPRLTLERPRPSLPDDVELEPALASDEGDPDAEAALDEGDEVIEAVMHEATPGGSGDANGVAANADAREGGRRRRRRRRRKGRGGEAADAAEAQASGVLEPAADAGWGESEELEGEDDDVDEERALADADAESSDESGGEDDAGDDRDAPYADEDVDDASDNPEDDADRDEADAEAEEVRSYDSGEADDADSLPPRASRDDDDSEVSDESERELPDDPYRGRRGHG